LAQAILARCATTVHLACRGRCCREALPTLLGMKQQGHPDAHQKALVRMVTPAPRAAFDGASVISLCEALASPSRGNGGQTACRTRLRQHPREERGNVSKLPSYLPSVLRIPVPLHGQAFPLGVQLVAVPAGMDWRRPQIDAIAPAVAAGLVAIPSAATDAAAGPTAVVPTPSVQSSYVPADASDKLPQPALPSEGSVGHAAGWCKPCAFVYTTGCAHGQACQFCHLCEPGEKKRRRKAKMERRRAAQKLRADARRHPSRRER